MKNYIKPLFFFKNFIIFIIDYFCLFKCGAFYSFYYDFVY